MPFVTNLHHGETLTIGTTTVQLVGSTDRIARLVVIAPREIPIIPPKRPEQGRLFTQERARLLSDEIPF